MKTYLIIFKLGFSEESYIKLVEYLKTANYWARPLSNMWIIRSFLTTAQIRDGITPNIYRSDQVFVVELGKDWATYNFNKTITDWLKNNL